MFKRTHLISALTSRQVSEIYLDKKIHLVTANGIYFGEILDIDEQFVILKDREFSRRFFAIETIQAFWFEDDRIAAVSNC